MSLRLRLGLGFPEEKKKKKKNPPTTTRLDYKSLVDLGLGFFFFVLTTKAQG